MKTTLLVLVCAFGLLAAATPALAGPACTCDPNPVTDLVRCLVNGDRCPAAIEGLDLPPLHEVLP